VSMRGHGDEIHLILPAGLDDLVGGLTHGQHGCYLKPFVLKRSGQTLKIGSIHLHLLALDKIELIIIPGDPPVRHMHQRKFGSGQFREGLDVLENGAIGLTIFQGDQDVLVHNFIFSE
jgi:hypothetical protein